MQILYACETMAGHKTYNKDVSELILDKIAQGEPLTQILNSNPEFPAVRTWFSWLNYEPTLRTAYQSAKAASLNQIQENIFDELKNLEDFSYSVDGKLTSNTVGLGKIELKFKFLQWQTGVRLGARIKGDSVDKQIKSLVR